ncbi:DUF4169 family protein [Zhengella sp. ZM62]|uniref:DUF4169 family protein n=1 Tax=Zhengella sedimenti TaxID=3390035 RepID=UPI0039760868
MAEIVNLRQVRKLREREERQRLADANRLLHGRTKAERKQAKTEKSRADRHLDGHNRRPDTPSS